MTDGYSMTAPGNVSVGTLASGLGRYGTALSFILYLLYNESTRDDPSPVRAVIFIALALLVMLAKYLAVRQGVKDDVDDDPPS